LIKLVMLIKRRAGMTFDEFVQYYETTHRAIGIKYNKGARHYTRRYLRKLENPAFGEQPEPEYDVLTELWYDDQAAFDAGLAQITAPDAGKAIAEDAAQLFDSNTKVHTFVIYDERSDDDL